MNDNNISDNSEYESFTSENQFKEIKYDINNIKKSFKKKEQTYNKIIDELDYKNKELINKNTNLNERINYLTEQVTELNEKIKKNMLQKNILIMKLLTFNDFIHVPIECDNINIIKKALSNSSNKLILINQIIKEINEYIN